MEDGLAPPERHLLTSLGDGKVCDLSGGESAPSPVEMGTWGAERAVSADLLRRLLLGEYPGGPPEALVLRGAVIDDVLDLEGAAISTGLRLEYCRIGGIRLGGATVTGDTTVLGVTFTRDAWFDGATFAGDARFDGTAFGSEARFDQATFGGSARFGGTSFAGDAVFDGATFTGSAWFGEATFATDTVFSGAVFAGDARFGGARFSGDTRFAGAVFGSEARFDEAVFAGDVGFDGASFTGDTLFTGAVFASDARFDEVVGARCDFTGARFDVSDLGTFAVDALTFDSADFRARTRMTVTATTMSCRHTQFRAGGHLWVHAADLDLAYAEFLGRTIVTDPGPCSTPARSDPGPRPEGFFRLPAPQRAEYTTRRSAHELARELGARPARKTRIVSVRRANVTDLTVSAVHLDTCRFAGAHGLDKLRIDAGCTLAYPPRGWRARRPFRFTRRRMIGEEAEWRRRYADWWGAPGAADCPDPPAALEIAGIYRHLRKGLEDAKNEPGAADFYYGEMEMRRLAARERHAGRRADGAEGTGSPPPAERVLLGGYWAVSGYGLRAMRAFTALAAVLLVAAGLLATVGVDPSASGRGFFAALEFAARDSLSLLRAPVPDYPLTPVGTIVDILLRLVGPLLVGLGLLAVRGRTRR
jgi:uncharacterized protein YjbI with pentapeptide repeats